MVKISSTVDREGNRKYHSEEDNEADTVEKIMKDYNDAQAKSPFPLKPLEALILRLLI